MNIYQDLGSFALQVVGLRQAAKALVIRMLIVLAFVIVASVCLVGCGNQDAEAEQATAVSVTDLGREARHQLSDAEVEALAAKVRLSYPLQPMKQLQADAAVRKENK